MIARLSPLVIIALSLLLPPQTAAAEELPISYFFKRPEIQSLSLSPDGQHAAAVIPREKQKIVAILDISDPLQAKVVQTLQPPIHQDAWSVFWLNNERLSFTTVEEQTSLNSPRSTGNLFASDIDGGNKEQLAGRDQELVFMAGFLDRADRRKSHVVVMSASPGDRKLKAEWLNINNGSTRLIDFAPMTSTQYMVLDHDQNVRFAVGSVTDKIDQRIMYRDAKGDWEEFKNPFGGELAIYGFNADNRTAWIASDDQQNFGLYSFDTESGQFELQVTDPVSEVVGVVWDNKGEQVIGAEFEPDRRMVRYLDLNHPDIGVRERLAAQFPGQFVDFTSFSKDGTRASVVVWSDINPGQVYVLDFTRNALVPIAPLRPWVEPEKMAERRPVQITTSDDWTIHGYLTLPTDAEPKNLPMVLLVHGGPHGPRDHWQFDGQSQLLANRGYAVLQVNFRGSGGYGHQFERSGFQQWGTRMQDDLTDATHWAIEQGIADRNRVCIFGASYGGYATLAGVTREPDLYRCGFAFVGVYDLELLKNSGDIARNKSGQDFLEHAVGTDEEDLRARSPIYHVDKIKAALYVAHGKEDDRADIKHFHALTDALDDAGIPYKELLTEKEAHGFWDLENQEMLYGEVLTFLNQHIGGGTPQNAETSSP